MPYTLSDFTTAYPQFTAVDSVYPIPVGILNAYVALANACLDPARWDAYWSVGCGFFVAHYCTLYAQGMAAPGSDAATIAGAGEAKGALVSESAEDLSASYQSIITGWEEWGVWNKTLFGQQFMQIASMVGSGGMAIW